MIKLIVNISTCALWMLGIVYLILRLRDIWRNFKKYDTVRGYDNYVNSQWYWHPKKEFGRLDPPHNSRFGGMNCALIVLGLILIPEIIFGDLYPNKQYLFTFSYVAKLLFMIIAAIMAALLAFYVPIHLKSPICICYNLHYIFKGKPRSLVWKRLTTYTLIGACLCFPLYLLAFNNYLYADEEKLVYSDFFSLEEKVMYYDDVSKIDISYTDKGLIESYVFVSEVGKTFPVYPGDFPNGELEDIIAKID